MYVRSLFLMFISQEHVSVMKISTLYQGMHFVPRNALSVVKASVDMANKANNFILK